jgi:hypothetical protein
MIKKNVERTGKGERKVLKTRLRPWDCAAAGLKGEDPSSSAGLRRGKLEGIGSIDIAVW